MYRAHAACYAARAEEADPHLQRAEQVEWLEVLDADHGNLSAATRRMIVAGEAASAHRLTAPLAWYWWMRGHRKEGQDLSMLVRDTEGRVDPPLRAKVAMFGTWGLWSGESRGAGADVSPTAAGALSTADRRRV
ncbi:hypothetical protein GCM10027447_27430 [Glycomyces halotolerans]